MLTHAHGSLDPGLEELVSRVIGCLIEVHRHLGPGYLESIYKRAVCIELALQDIPFEQERSLSVVYKGKAILGQRLDLLVDGRLIRAEGRVASGALAFQPTGLLFESLRLEGWTVG